MIFIEKTLGKKRFKPKTYVLGDLHGAYKALRQVLRKAHFDYEHDTLIFIGDLADGWGEFNLCLRELLKIKNLIPLLGNHDLFLRKYIFEDQMSDRWLNQGGETTLDVLEEDPDIVDDLKLYFDMCKYYHVYEDKIFCHGGFNHNRLITKQKSKTFSINRHLNKVAKKYDRQRYPC